ncbi:MAG: hypothetical protein HZC06_02245 [Methylocystis sp.]|nr:hypothetical protein [Methylocystis sp.]
MKREPGHRCQSVCGTTIDRVDAHEERWSSLLEVYNWAMTPATLLKAENVI